MTDNGADHARHVPFRGIVYLLAAIALLSVQDVMIRLLSASGSYAVHQIVFVRSFFSMAIVLVIVRLEGGWSGLRTRKKGLQFTRGTLAFCAYTFFYLAISVLPLATAVTIFYVAPLIVTALSVPLLHERVGVHRWLAVLIGFGGVAIIANPQAGGLSWGIVFALVSATAYSGVILITRLMGGTETSSGVSFYSILLYLVYSSVLGLGIGDGAYMMADHPAFDFLLRAWTVPVAPDFGLMALCGIIWGVAFYLLTRAYMLASAVTVAPFEYTAMPLAVLWGYVFWQEIPALSDVSGIALIVGAGIYIIWREAGQAPDP